MHRRLGPAGIRRGLRTPTTGAPASGPFSPSDVTGLEAWYRETYAAGTWADLSGNGRDLTTLTGTPSQVTRSGQLAISLNGSTALSGAFGVTLDQPTTAYVVFETTVAFSRVVFCGDDTTNRQQFQATLAGGQAIYAGTVLSADGTLAAGIHAAACIFNSTTSALYEGDFATAAVSGNAGTNKLDGLIVGARPGPADLFTGYVWELIVYSGAHDAATRKLIGDYFTARYSGLTVTT